MAAEQWKWESRATKVGFLTLTLIGVFWIMESAIGQPPPPEPLAVTWTLDISNVPSNGGRVEHEYPAVHCRDRIFGSYDYLDGHTASITARAYSGYRFSHWSGAASGSRSSRTVYMDRDRSVTAHWERIPATTYNLRVIADPSDGRGGYVEITGGTLVSAGTKRFIQGARAVVEARSNSGWRFVRWSGDVSGSSARQTLTMNSNRTATALLQRATIQRTLTAHVVGNGRVIPSGSTFNTTTDPSLAYKQSQIVVIDCAAGVARSLEQILGTLFI